MSNHCSRGFGKRKSINDAEAKHKLKKASKKGTVYKKTKCNLFIVTQY